MYIHAHMHTCIPPYIPTSIQTYIHTYVHTYIHMYSYACIHEYAYTLMYWTRICLYVSFQLNNYVYCERVRAMHVELLRSMRTRNDSCYVYKTLPVSHAHAHRCNMFRLCDAFAQATSQRRPSLLSVSPFQCCLRTGGASHGARPPTPRSGGACARWRPRRTCAVAAR